MDSWPRCCRLQPEWETIHIIFRAKTARYHPLARTGGLDGDLWVPLPRHLPDEPHITMSLI